MTKLICRYGCPYRWGMKNEGAVVYPSDAIRVLRDEGLYYLMALPKYALY